MASKQALSNSQEKKVNVTTESEKLTPSEIILSKEKKEVNKISLTPSEKILAKEKKLRENATMPPKEDFLCGKALLRPDSEKGIITDPTQIKFYKATLIKDIFMNGLLGEYDEQGNYSLCEDIRKELVSLEKESGEGFEELYFAVSRSKDDPSKSIKFSVQISKNDTGSQTAVLKILEEIEKNGGMFNNTISTFVASYTDTSESFLFDAFKVFNISRKGESQNNFMNEKIAPITVLRRNTLKNIKDKFVKEFSKEEKELLEKRIKTLEQNGEKGQEIITKLKTSLNQCERYMPEKLLNSYIGTQNNILENLVDSSQNFSLLGSFTENFAFHLSNFIGCILSPEEHLCMENIFKCDKDFFHDSHIERHEFHEQHEHHEHNQQNKFEPKQKIKSKDRELTL